MKVKSTLTGLNEYQLKSIEKQRAVYALLFENLLFTMLITFIQIDWIKCPELKEG